jgi:dihydroneopterin aldolase
MSDKLKKAAPGRLPRLAKLCVRIVAQNGFEFPSSDSVSDHRKYTVSVYRVLLEGIEVKASIGVSEAERKAGHRLRVDVSLEVRGLAPRTDEIRDTVDYSELADEVAACLEATSFKTLERLAAELAERVLKRFGQCESVTIRLEKPGPPMPRSAERAGVELTLARS